MSEKVEYIISLRDLFSPKLKDATEQTNVFNKTVNSLQSNIAKLGLSIGAAFAARDIVQTTARFNSLELAIRAGSSTADEGTRTLQFLNNTVDNLGLSLEEAYRGFKTFQGAVKGTALDGEVGRRIFSQTSKAITAMGLSGEDAEGIFLAMGQMISKGAVYSEELRGQFGERLPGAFKKAADSMGYTTEVLSKQMQLGNVMAEDLLPRLSEALGIEFNAAAYKASDGLQAMLNKANNEFTRLKILIGTEFLPVIIQALNIFREIVSIGGEVVRFIKDHATAIGVLIGAYIGLKAAVMAYNTYAFIANAFMGAKAIYQVFQLARALQGLSVAQMLLNTATAIFDALTLNWGALAVAGAVAVAGGIMTAYAAQKMLNGEVEKGVKLDREQTALRDAIQGEQWSPYTNGKVFKPISEPLKGGKSTSASKGGGTNISDVSTRGHQNFNISIDKLIEQLTIQTTNLKESSNAVKAEVTKAMIEAINDFQIMATK